ncbi:MAG: SIMPL domain-containing protein [bacterium]
MLKNKKIKLDKNHRIVMVSLAGLLGLFLLVTSVSTIFGISNKIKTGRYIGQDIQIKNTITVADIGEVYAKPDLALTDFSVVTEAVTVVEAMKQNTDKMNTIISFIKRQGVDNDDLKTTNFNIYPRYEYQERSTFYPTGERVLVGYEVNQTLQVKIRELDKIGQIIQGATDAGANQIGNLQFTIDNQDELKKEARELAIEKAKEKAKELAKQLDVSLVRIIDFNEGIDNPVFRTLNASVDEAYGLGGGEPQIETVQNKIEVNVSITYEIN